MTVSDIAPPLQTEWWDTPTTVAAVLARLRLRPGDVDEPRITAAVAEAGEMINDHLDRELVDDEVEAPPTAVMQGALERLTVELVGRRPLTSGTGGVLRTQQVELDTQPDSMQLHDLLVSLLPLKERWGVA